MRHVPGFINGGAESSNIEMSLRLGVWMPLSHAPPVRHLRGGCIKPRSWDCATSPTLMCHTFFKAKLVTQSGHDKLAAKDGEIGKDGPVLQPHLSRHRLSRPQQLCSPDQLWAMYIYALYHRTQPYVELPQLFEVLRDRVGHTGSQMIGPPYMPIKTLKSRLTT